MDAPLEKSTQERPRGIKLEDAIIRTLRECGLLVERIKNIDNIFKSDFVVYPAGCQPIYVQVTGKIGAVCKMREFACIRSLRRERGIYIQFENTEPTEVTAWLWRFLLDTNHRFNQEDSQVLFVDFLNNRLCTERSLDDEITELEDELDIRGLSPERIFGQIVQIEHLQDKPLRIWIRHADGREFKSFSWFCLDQDLYVHIRKVAAIKDRETDPIHVSFFVEKQKSRFGFKAAYGLIYRYPKWHELRRRREDEMRRIRRLEETSDIVDTVEKQRLERLICFSEFLCRQLEMELGLLEDKPA